LDFVFYKPSTGSDLVNGLGRILDQESAFSKITMNQCAREQFGKILSSFFDRIYCINLDTRPDRWKYVSTHFRKFGLHKKVERFSAVDIRMRKDLAQFETLQRKNFSLLGNCGCILSHRQILEMAQSEGLESILILEDDVEFLEENLSQVDATLRELADLNWHVFYLGASYIKPFLSLSNHLINVNQGANATHAISYHRSVFKGILDLIPAKPEELIKRNIDSVNAIDIWLRSDSLDHSKFYGSNPIMAVQGLQNSDIAKTQQNSIRDKQIELFNKHLKSQNQDGQ